MPLILAATLVAACAAAASILWYSIRTGIAPMPSSRKACRAMLEPIARGPAGSVADLGSGWGTVAIACARRFPGRQVIGYEVSWLPWAVSILLQRLLRLRNLRFVRADFRHVALSGHAVLLCYLYRQGMRDLAHKLDQERAWPPLLVSSTFAMPHVRPVCVRRLDDLYRTRVYEYRRG